MALLAPGLAAAFRFKRSFLHVSTRGYGRSTFRLRQSSLLILCLALSLLALMIPNKPFLTQTRSYFSNFAWSAVQILEWPVIKAEETFSFFTTFLTSQNTLQQEIKWLRAQNAALLQWQTRAKTLEQEAVMLRHQAALVKSSPLKIVSSQIIARQIDMHGQSVIINTPMSVQKDQAVMTDDGLLGRIIESGEPLSRVMLIQDVNSRVPVMIEGTECHGILIGQNSPFLHLQYVTDRRPLAVGQTIVTSGYGGIFPAGLPVAVITTVEGDHIIARPLASSNSPYVLIMEPLKSAA